MVQEIRDLYVRDEEIAGVRWYWARGLRSRTPCLALAQREPLAGDSSFAAIGMGEEDESADHSQCHLQRAISPLSPLFLHAESN